MSACSARVILLFRIYKHCLVQPFHRFWEIQFPSQESLRCVAMWGGMLNFHISEFSSKTKTTCVECALCDPAREGNLLEKVFIHVSHTARHQHAMGNFLCWQIGKARFSGVYWDSAIQWGMEINSLQAVTWEYVPAASRSWKVSSWNGTSV